MIALRKFGAILLILVLLFNLCGYRIMIPLLQNNADIKLETRLDNNDYDESQLVEIRVPLNMPYQERFTEFERHYGEIEIDGKLYTYVKRKIEGDILVLKCIVNESKQLIKAAGNDWVKIASGIDMDHSGPVKSQQHNTSLAKSFWAEYDGQDAFYKLSSGVMPLKNLFATYSVLIPEVILNTPYQPPESPRC